MIDNYLQRSYHSWDEVYTCKDYNSSIYIGDVQSALDLQFIKEKGIKTVVTAAKGLDHIKYDQSIKHIVYPLLDGKNENIASFFDQFFQLVQTYLPLNSILVHCAVGISRSSTLVISYLMKKQQLTFRKAIDFVRQSRPNVLPNLGFERQLKRYEQILSKKVKYSRGMNSRNESKTSESNINHPQRKTQFLPILGMMDKLKQKDKYLSVNSKHTSEKMIDKDLQVLRIYNNFKSDHQPKKLFLHKKPVSFSRHFDKRREGTKSTHAEPSDQSQPLKVINQDRIGRLKTPIDKIKDIYLARKNIVFPETSQASHRQTLYTIMKPKQ